MVVVTMKNLKQRGDKSHFRMALPKDCQESVGKAETIEIQQG